MTTYGSAAPAATSIIEAASPRSTNRGSASPAGYSYGAADARLASAPLIAGALAVGMQRGRAANEATVPSRLEDARRRGVAAGVLSAPEPAEPEGPTVSFGSGPDPDDPIGAGGFPDDAEEASQTPIVIELDSSDLTLAVVVVRYRGGTSELVAYRRGSFRRGFTSQSWQEEDGTITRLHILPDGGWPPIGDEEEDEEDIVIDVDAVAGGGLSDIAGSS